MAQKKTKGIVLSRNISGEADYICSILTEDLGKEKFIFKGLKKSLKRPKSASEPGTFLDLVYYSRDSLSINTVSEFSIFFDNSQFRKNEKTISSLYYIVDLIDSTTATSDANTSLYNLVAYGLYTLSKTENHLHFLIFFMVRYLMIQGILPELRACSWCGASTDEEFFLNRANLKLSCTKCLCDDNSISGKAVIFLQQALDKKFVNIKISQFQNGEIIPLFDSLHNYIESYFGTKLKSYKIIRQYLATDIY
ncbi:MAG TPA: DNA repair protein RecO [Spirochaetota bacterium]|nr:DNA repair protein RecO [Spirochaetota bacterium]